MVIQVANIQHLEMSSIIGDFTDVFPLAYGRPLTLSTPTRPPVQHIPLAPVQSMPTGSPSAPAKYPPTMYQVLRPPPVSLIPAKHPTTTPVLHPPIIPLSLAKYLHLPTMFPVLHSPSVTTAPAKCPPTSWTTPAVHPFQHSFLGKHLQPLEGMESTSYIKIKKIINGQARVLTSEECLDILEKKHKKQFEVKEKEWRKFERARKRQKVGKGEKDKREQLKWKQIHALVCLHHQPLCLHQCHQLQPCRLPHSCLTQLVSVTQLVIKLNVHFVVPGKKSLNMAPSDTKMKCMAVSPWTWPLQILKWSAWQSRKKSLNMAPSDTKMKCMAVQGRSPWTWPLQILKWSAWQSREEVLEHGPFRY